MHEFIEEIKFIKADTLFFIKQPIKLCRLPYPGHKNGCPNVDKNKSCPPFVERLEEVYHIGLLCEYLYYVKFNIKRQKEKMKTLCPNWSDKKCKCLLYWQKSVIKTLKENVINFINIEELNIGKLLSYELIPEAMGLDIFKTMGYYGITLERNPENYVYKVAFIGVLR